MIFSELEWKNNLKDVLERNAPSAEYLRGLINGINSVMTYHDVHDVINSIIDCLPVKFNYFDIPVEWIFIVIPKSRKIRLDNVPSFESLWNSLPESEKTNIVYPELIHAYLSELSYMEAIVNGSKNPENVKVIMRTFNTAGKQNIADFSVNDTSKAIDYGKMNWHGQNTSQWLYAGCICIEDGRVSRHH